MYKWRTIDWIWLLVFLIYAQGILFLYNELVLTVVSYVSTFVSIALAGVAIYISIREATKSDRVKDDISMVLGEMKEKIGQLDNKMSNIDINAINTKIINGIDEGLSKIGESIKFEVVENKNISEEELIPYLDKMLSKMSEDLKSSLVVRQPLEEKRVLYPADTIDVEQLAFTILGRSSSEITKGQLNRNLFDLTGKMLDDKTLEKVMINFTKREK